MNEHDDIMNVSTNNVTGVSRYIDDGIESEGWYIKETHNNETNKSYMELGIEIDGIFLSVPVDYKLRKCIPTNVHHTGSDGANYYILPPNMYFGVKKIFIEKLGKEKVFLTAPCEEYPGKFLSLVVIKAPAINILDVTFNCGYDIIRDGNGRAEDVVETTKSEENVKIIRKYFNKSRNILAMIIMSDTQEVDIKVLSGMPTFDKTCPVKTATRAFYSFAAGTTPVRYMDEVSCNEGFENKFIEFPMLIEAPKKERTEREFSDRPYNPKFNKKFNDRNSGRKHEFDKNFKKDRKYN